MAIKTILIVIANVCFVYAVKRCCNNEHNFITKDLKKCLDGSEIDITPPCTLFAVDTNQTSIRVDSEDNLYFDGDPVPPHQYCFAMDQNSTHELYMVCGDGDGAEQSIDILKNVCQIISVLFMILTVVIYISLPQMMDLQGQAIVHSISGKALAYITLIALYIIPYLGDVSCHIAAYLLYISFLYAFFWLNILCFQIWRQIVNPRVLNYIKNWKLVYYVYGIGGSLVCWAILTLIQHSEFEYIKHLHPGIGEVRCWFKTMREAMIYFYAPISVLIVANIVYFIWTLVVLSKQYTNSRTNQVFKYRLKLYIKLFFIMGITWLFEVISSATENHPSLKWLWVVTDVINSLEGLTIFLILVVFRKKVMRHLANKSFCKCLKLPSAWKNLEDTECEPVEYELSMASDADKI